MSSDTEVLSEILREAAQRLIAAGIADGMADARILVCAATGLSREDLLREPHRRVSRAHLDLFGEMVRRRTGREPVSRILGHREFRSLEFSVGPDTLDPRPDSETVVDAVLDHAKRFDDAVRVLDLGTGTGCLLLAVLNELPQAEGVGVDIADGAVEMATRNAAALGLSDRVKFLQSDWTESVNGKFELVISNPPYIERDEIPRLMPEVSRHDPIRALDGGADGLDAYRAIADRLGHVLSPGGVAIFEIGSAQQDTVTDIFAGLGFERIDVRRDLAGHVRALAFNGPGA